MDRSSNDLLSARANVSSQTGEDGVIGRIIDLLPSTDKWCVEFGAWDGEHLSNSRNLIVMRGYSAVLIEGSVERFRKLERFYEHQPQIKTLNRFVGASPDDGLDQILDGVGIPTDFDLLSIDIDGNDYYVWKAVTRYRPKIVCIEFNPTIPTEVRFVQAQDLRVNQGASLRSLVDLAKSKGYELVAVLPFNALFVREELFPLYGVADNRPEVLRTDVSSVTYLFSGYDGRIFLDGSRRLPWHGVTIPADAFQHLPSILRAYPENYGLFQRIVFQCFEC